jgi:hypothetical protein
MADQSVAAASTSSPSPPPLSDHYHNARNKYALCSALLLAWDFLGLQIDIRGLFASVSVSIPTPEKVPILLVGLVLYHAYRICIEWNQCDRTRRSYRSSRVDFVITHLIGFASVVTYGIQQTVPPWLEQLVIDKAPTVLILLAMLIFVPYGKIVQDFLSKGFNKNRWYSRKPMIRLLTFTSCWSVAQAFYIQFAVESVMGSEVIQKGNNTYPALVICSLYLFLLGSVHETLLSRLQQFRLKLMG